MSYLTQNIYEASYLLTKGHKIKGKSQQSSRIKLEFEDIGGKAEKDGLAYYAGGKKTMVSAKELTDNFRTLKDYMFER